MNGEDEERRDELASLYALGVIDGAGHAALRQELAATPAFAADLRALVQVAVGFAQAIPSIEPPAALRARVLTVVTGKTFGPASASGSALAAASAAGPGEGEREGDSTRAIAPPSPYVVKVDRPARAWTGWLAAAAALIIAIGTGVYALQLRDRIAQTEQRATQAERGLLDVRRALGESESQTRTLRLQAAVLIAPDMARIDLAGQKPVAPTAAARAFWSRQRGMVFAATSLPPLPSGKTYQLWVLPQGGGAPISAGLLAPDQQGSINAHFVTPPDIPTPVALAVTLEPEGGVPAPTGDKFLVGMTGL